MVFLKFLLPKVIGTSLSLLHPQIHPTQRCFYRIGTVFVAHVGPPENHKVQRLQRKS